MEKIRKLRFFQSREYISIDYTRQDVGIFTLDGTTGGFPRIVSRKLTPARQEPLELELRAFLDAVRGLGPVECPGNEGRRTLELALQILDRAERAQAQALQFDRT